MFSPSSHTADSKTNQSKRNLTLTEKVPPMSRAAVLRSLRRVSGSVLSEGAEHGGADIVIKSRTAVCHPRTPHSSVNHAPTAPRANICKTDGYGPFTHFPPIPVSFAHCTTPRPGHAHKHLPLSHSTDDLKPITLIEAQSHLK